MVKIISVILVALVVLGGVFNFNYSLKHRSSVGAVEIFLLRNLNVRCQHSDYDVHSVGQPCDFTVDVLPLKCYGLRGNEREHVWERSICPCVWTTDDLQLRAN
ncbi:hypothetical protein L798_09172 [Zootermopsis nevadensis]|uniref:Uncharacterized protein n=1 Tax=Zootermopsis nevadensis TaxID=136037 RepID=A0A067QYB6_ZOONE|nr:hypothetical protein L798_09172 [Zootermopsis nevadensis]